MQQIVFPTIQRVFSEGVSASLRERSISWPNANAFSRDVRFAPETISEHAGADLRVQWAIFAFATLRMAAGQSVHIRQRAPARVADFAEMSLHAGHNVVAAR